MTDYKKWNSMKLEDLGWSEQDEINERMTPALREMINAQQNDKKLREARDALQAARKEQARLMKLTTELNDMQTSRDWWTNVMAAFSIVVVAAALFGLHYMIDQAPPAKT